MPESGKTGEAREAAHRRLRAAEPTLEVGVVEVAPRDGPLSFEYAGRTAGAREGEVRARVSGILLERTYVEGQRVEAGQVLFRIDPQPFEVALQQAEPRLQNEQALLRQADRNWARAPNLSKAMAGILRAAAETIPLQANRRTPSTAPARQEL